MVVVGHQWSKLAPALAKHHQIAFVPFSIIQFADKEISIIIQEREKIDRQDIALVYQISHPEPANSINDQLVGLFYIVNHLKILGAQSIKVLLPYLPYGRQDLTPDKKSPGAVYMIGQSLKSLGVTAVFACDLHAPLIIKDFTIPLYNIALDHFWADTISRNIIKHGNPKDFCIVSPDKGGHERVQHVASLLGISSAFIRKNRIGIDIIQAQELIGNVSNKKIILLDDIIDTASTAISASNLILQQGAVSIFGCFTHAVLSAGSLERLAQSSFEQVFVTDTINRNQINVLSKLQILSIETYINKVL